MTEKQSLLGIQKYGVIPAVPGTSKIAGNWHFQFLSNKKIILTKREKTAKE